MTKRYTGRPGGNEPPTPLAELIAAEAEYYAAAAAGPESLAALAADVASELLQIPDDPGHCLETS